MASALRLGLATVCLALPLAASAADSPWPADVKDWKKPEPGEHPRLLFRKGDVPDIRKRAETPEGKAIVRRLRFLLDGKNGDTLLPPGQPEHTVGGFTIGHAAGYGPKDGYKPKFGPVLVWGLGKRYEFGSFTAAKPPDFAHGKDGSGVVAADGKHLAVDFSGASGAPLLLVGIGIGEGKSDPTAQFTKVTAGGQTFTVLTLSKDKHPEVKADGDKVTVGGQTVTFDSKRIAFAK
jgi:hypothetical protein